MSKPKKSIVEKRNAKRAVTGRDQEPYEAMIERIHATMPDNTYLQQLIDPRNAPRRGLPDCGRKTCILRGLLPKTVSPDTYGILSAISAPHPDYLLTIRSAGTTTYATTFQLPMAPGNTSVIFGTHPTDFYNTEDVGYLPFTSTSVQPGCNYGIHTDWSMRRFLPVTSGDTSWVPTRGSGDLTLLQCSGASSIRYELGNWLTRNSPTSPTDFAVEAHWYTADLRHISTLSNPFIALSTGIVSSYFYSFNPVVAAPPADAHYVGFRFVSNASATWCCKMRDDDGAVGAGLAYASPTFLTCTVVGMQCSWRTYGYQDWQSSDSIYDNVRCVGLSLLDTDMSASLVVSGGLGAATLPPMYFQSIDPSLTYQSIVSIPENSYDGVIKKGAYGYYVPYSESDSKKYLRNHVPLQAVFNMPCLAVTHNYGELPEGMSAPLICRLEVSCLFECTSTSQLVTPIRGPVAPLEQSVALEYLSRTPQWCENPFHEKLISGIRNAARQVVEKGPAIANIAMKGAQYAKYLAPIAAALL